MPVFLEVTRQTVLLQLRSKLYRWMVILALAFVIAFPTLVPEPEDMRGDWLFEIVTYFGGFGMLIPFVTLFLSGQAIGGDIEDRISVFLFTRPIHRASLLVGKWLAAILLSWLFVTVVMTTLYLVISLGGREWRHDALPIFDNYLRMLLAAWLAVIAYSAVGCFLGAFFRRPILMGILYILLEQFASRLPPQVAIHNATVAFPTRAFMYQGMEPTRPLRHLLQGVISEDDSAGQELILGSNPTLALLKVVAIALVLALFVYTRREYDSRPRE